MQFDIQIIEFKGRLNGPSGIRLLEAVGQCLQSGITSIVIDLAAASFADSAGLAGLVRSYKLVRQAGGRMALCSPQIQVAFLLELTFMKKTFEIFDTREAFYQSWLNQFPGDARIASLDSLPIVRVVASD